MYNHTSYTVMAEISCMIKAKFIIDVLGIQVFKAKCQANVHPHIWHWYGQDFLFDQSKSQNMEVPWNLVKQLNPIKTATDTDTVIALNVS